MKATPPLTVLVVDDEAPILESVSYSLRKEGYQVLEAMDASQCLELARSRKPDVVILDVMLPTASGIDVCRVLRSESDVPIILLTARAAETDRVVGLEIGADDYITKPFSMRELVARVRSVHRRAVMQHAAAATVSLRAGDIIIASLKHEVTVDGRPVELSPREFDLLSFFLRHPDQAFSRQTLLDEVWGADAYVEERTVDVHVRWLREKIEHTPSAPRHLLTVRGVGYKFKRD